MEFYLDGDLPVRGFLDTPEAANGAGLVLAHGAGSNARASLLAAIADALCAKGFTVLRIDLPFRQARPTGPPFPAMAAKDRAGLARAASALKERVRGKVFLGGHSYGGRQSSMLASEQADVAAGLLLLSYPLHPPRRPEQLRTGHFPALMTPALFVHGSRDPCGSLEELRAAVTAIPAPHDILAVEGAGHDLGGAKGGARLATAVVDAFLKFTALASA